MDEFMEALARLLFKKATELIVPSMKVQNAVLADRFDTDFASIAGEDIKNFVAVQKEKGYVHIKNGENISEDLGGNFVDILYHDGNYFMYESKEKAIYKKSNDASFPVKWINHTGPNTIFSKSMRVGKSGDHLLVNEKAKRVRYISIETPEKNFTIKFRSTAKSKMLCH